jgi:hypothetical protein
MPQKARPEGHNSPKCLAELPNNDDGAAVILKCAKAETAIK